MSLINKLLQDLEKREAHFDEPPGSILDGLYSAYDVEQRSVRRRPIILVIFGLVVLVPAVIAGLVLNPVSIAHLQLNPGNTGKIGDPAVLESVEPAQAEDKTAGPPPVATRFVPGNETVTTGTDSKAVHSSGNMQLHLDLDQGITVRRSAELVPAGLSPATPELSTSPPASTATVLLEREQQGLVLSFQLTRKVPYQVYTLDSPHRIVFELDDIRLDKLPDFSNIENIIAVRKHRNKSGQLRFVIESAAPYIIGQSNMQQLDNHYALRIHLLTVDPDPQEGRKYVADPSEHKQPAGTGSDNPPPRAETVVKGDIVKHARKPVAISETDNLLYQSEKLYRQGNITGALDRLNAAVENEPRHRVARTRLALRLSEQQQTDLAIKVLQEGLAIIPDMPDWALVLAQIHMRDGRLAAAEKVLSGAIPPVADNQDYNALYAAVLQKLEKHRKAAEIYRNLLQVNPENGIWWMGLAISLEAISMSNDARFAYRNALAVKSLTPEIQQYIIERIRILEQQIGNEPS